MIPDTSPCVYLRAGKCIAKCDGMCPKLKYQCIIDELCLNPPKCPSPYPDIFAIRKDEREKVLVMFEKLHTHGGGDKITDLPRLVWRDELDALIEELRQDEREKVLESLDEFTWLRYKENRIEKDGLEEHCIIRGEILRLKVELRKQEEK